MTFVHVVTYPSQPLTLLHQIDVLLLVYAFQPGWPAARTAAAAKVILKVKNLYTILKTFWNNWKSCNIQSFLILSKKKVYSRQDNTIISCQISHLHFIFPLLSFITFTKTSKVKVKFHKVLVVSSHFNLSEWLYILVGMVHAIVRLWFFYIWLIVIIGLCNESFDHWNLLNHVILCDTKSLLSWAIVRTMVYE